jgi:hypothetical protein
MPNVLPLSEIGRMPGSGVSIPPKIVNRKNRAVFIAYNRYIIKYKNKTRLDIIGLKIDLVLISPRRAIAHLDGTISRR